MDWPLHAFCQFLINQANSHCPVTIYQTNPIAHQKRLENDQILGARLYAALRCNRLARAIGGVRFEGHRKRWISRTSRPDEIVSGHAVAHAASIASPFHKQVSQMKDAVTAREVARLGDTTDHGGKVVEAADHLSHMGIRVALDGH